MPNNRALTSILIATRTIWDNNQWRPAARAAFLRAIECGTAAAGALVFASANQELRVNHTCKSKACPSCGRRATLQWQRELYCRLPDMPFHVIGLSMPGDLWSILLGNRHLLRDLPAVGARVVEHYIQRKYGAKVFIVVILHTFGGFLNWNTHLHLLVSAEGLSETDYRWITGLVFGDAELAQLWRDSVMAYLQHARQAGRLSSPRSEHRLQRLFAYESRRQWRIDVQHFSSKKRFIEYAGRYLRRPPLAESRIVALKQDNVQFIAKDRLHCRNVLVTMNLRKFIATLSQHVPERYEHCVRYFGLLAPACKQTEAAFIVLGQKRRNRPKKLSWRESLIKYFGRDPLLDNTGTPMVFIRRVPGYRSFRS